MHTWIAVSPQKTFSNESGVRLVLFERWGYPSFAESFLILKATFIETVLFFCPSASAVEMFDPIVAPESSGKANTPPSTPTGTQQVLKAAMYSRDGSVMHWMNNMAPQGTPRDALEEEDSVLLGEFISPIKDPIL